MYSARLMPVLSTCSQLILPCNNKDKYYRCATSRESLFPDERMVTTLRNFSPRRGHDQFTMARKLVNNVLYAGRNEVDSPV